MRVKEIFVPVELLSQIANLLGEHEIVNEIIGTNDEEEIHIQIQYEKSDREILHQIDDLLEDFREPEEEEETEDED